MCGEHDAHTAIRRSDRGSSPHVRGALFSSLVSFRIWGIIPACAGSTLKVCITLWVIGDHPRMCGEHVRRVPNRRPCEGSSPHVRGALGERSAQLRVNGIIPACAGSTFADLLLLLDGDHPRMCGEHSSGVSSSSASSGIIPACAGSTSIPSRSTPSCRDHPRSELV